MLFCPNCGVKIVQGDKFCRECGHSLTVIRTENVNSGRDEQKGNPLLTGMFISETPKNSFPGMGMMGLGMMGFGMMGSFTSGGRHFSYSTNGMAFNFGLNYSISEKEGKLYARMRLPGHYDPNVREFEIPDEIFDRITDVINEFNGDRWDGFNGHAVGVMDGESFSFSYNDGNGRSISAGGYMSMPEGFGGAINVIKGIMEDAYHKKFPDYSEKFRKFFEEDVVAKYGESNRHIKVGDYYALIPYVCGDPGYFAWGENPLPAGLLDYRIFNEYCDTDNNSDDIKYRGIAVLVDKKPADDGSMNYTGIKIQYYGMDGSGEIGLFEEFTVFMEAVRGQSGSFRVFTYKTAYGPILGIWEDISWKYGNTHQAFTFYLYKINKDKLEAIDEIYTEVTGEDSELTDEQLELLCSAAKKAGAYEWAQYFRRTQPRKYISMPDMYIEKIAGFDWHSHFCPDFNDLTGKLPKGKQVGDSHIKVTKI